MTIYFYSAHDQPYGCFSNFSPHGFSIAGIYYKTSEHYFQAQKFIHSPVDAEAVRLAKTPKQAAEIGRDRSRPLRRDWDAVKDDIMRAGVLEKFRSHPDIRAVLLSTGDEELLENAPNDYYWGCGADGAGHNRLGQILMTVRAQLRAET